MRSTCRAGGKGTAAGDADLAAVAAALADRGRARMLLALGDGRSLPPSVLAAEAGVAPATASSHLNRLLQAGLVTVTIRGRLRYYALAGPAVGELLETLARLAPTQQVRSLREGTRAYAVRRARSCYDHLAGRLGVALTAAMRDAGHLARHDGGIDLDRTRGPWAAGPDPMGYLLTAAGRQALVDLGVDVPAGDVVRCCVDWTEQRHHVAGPHGRAILGRLLSLDWVRRVHLGRALLLTDTGRAGLAETFGLTDP